MVKKFSLGGFYLKHKLLVNFLQYRKENLDKFYPDRIVDSCYDICGDSVWGGGRESFDPIDKVSIQEIVKTFSEQFPEIELRYVFTNNVMPVAALYDYKSNYFLQNIIRPQDKVIVNHPALITHLEINYPTVKYMYSTTMNIKDIDKVNEMTKNHIYVMNYNYNNDNDYLSKLEHKENIEILCAEPCAADCQYRVEHYTNISERFLGWHNNLFKCPYFNSPATLTDSLSRPNAINNERIEELSEMGFNYFKISGRGLKVPAWIDPIIYYLVLPKYVDAVKELILTNWW